MQKEKKAVILLSGGQDSATCLLMALQKHRKSEDLLALSINYKQEHNIEVFCAESISHSLDIPFQSLHVVIPTVSALTNKSLSLEKNEKHEIYSELPSSFVPGRNALFLTYAHIVAQTCRANEIWIGANQTDYSGYPDCREEFIHQMEFALNIGYQTNIEIVAPLLHKTKAETFRIVADMPLHPLTHSKGNNPLDFIIRKTHTCYNGVRNTLFPWGYGCGECNACILRKKGFEEFIEKKEKGEW